jgi:bifunctional UDP-N-acetylglucosamine pyrophosphorylase / glucosamine-1-phosphate N-acetyltransferase
MENTIGNASVILAGGKGTRLGEGTRKPARMLFNKPLVRWIVEASIEAGCDPIVVVVPDEKNGGAEVREAAGAGVQFAIQENPNGTGNAFDSAREILKNFEGDIFTTVGDAPAFTSEMIIDLIKFHKTRNSDITFATGEYEITPPYGRVIRENQTRNDKIVGIVEEVDADENQKTIKEVITSQWVFNSKKIWSIIDQLSIQETTGEINLTEVVEIAIADSERVNAWRSPKPESLLGVNTPSEFKEMEKQLSKLFE